MTVPIPDTHRDLLQTPVHAVLTTMMPDGAPQSSIVWVDVDGEYVLINTTLERQKGRNMRNNPKVTVLVIDPRDSSRWIEIRGKVTEMTQMARRRTPTSSPSGIPIKCTSTGTFTRLSRRIKKPG